MRKMEILDSYSMHLEVHDFHLEKGGGIFSLTKSIFRNLLEQVYAHFDLSPYFNLPIVFETFGFGACTQSDDTHQLKYFVIPPRFSNHLQEVRREIKRVTALYKKCVEGPMSIHELAKKIKDKALVSLPKELDDELVFPEYMDALGKKYGTKLLTLNKNDFKWEELGDIIYDNKKFDAIATSEVHIPDRIVATFLRKMDKQEVLFIFHNHPYPHLGDSIDDWSYLRSVGHRLGIKPLQGVLLVDPRDLRRKSPKQIIESYLGRREYRKPEKSLYVWDFDFKVLNLQIV
jgi:hypothetical protein